MTTRKGTAACRYYTCIERVGYPLTLLFPTVFSSSAIALSILRGRSGLREDDAIAATNKRTNPKVRSKGARSRCPGAARTRRLDQSPT